MKSIDLRAALIAANNINLNLADALVETTVLKQLIESCKTRIDALDTDAKTLAKQELEQSGADKGKFDHLGHHYILDREAVYDIIGKPQRYNFPDAATYRSYAREQKALKDQSSSLTKKMKAIYDAIPTDHPNLVPDTEKTTLKCLD